MKDLKYNDKDSLKFWWRIIVNNWLRTVYPQTSASHEMMHFDPQNYQAGLISVKKGVQWVLIKNSTDNPVQFFTVTIVEL